ncbi:tail fiber domain-containing protein [Kineosporia babensis]|uniref:Tail fiber domain-containing protein n=1 Tax=Kineosporia babensis TaxID=499548 RepID=A0A9X1NMR7_9ACTN|nr:tail fiber domain-containing protein [Kineosporia babensis]MCD5315948.1 tail fiber domain-containing protein [Kineosporia babensis]
MSSGLTRTQYWNVGQSTPTPRPGSTARAESQLDLEEYLLAADRARNTGLVTPGVVSGLEVTATVGSSGLTVNPGTAVDAAGRVVVLAAGGRAIVDPNAGPGVQLIPTVPVPEGGLTFDTTALTGDWNLTLTWREVEDVLAGILVLRHAPWLRLRDPSAFVDNTQEIVLASVTFNSGTVETLTVGLRRTAGARAGRLELTRPAELGSSVQDVLAAELTASEDGGVDLRLLTGSGTLRTALSIAGETADIRLEGFLQAAGGLAVSGDLSSSENLLVAGRTELAGPVVMNQTVDLGGALTGVDAAFDAIQARKGVIVGAGGDAVLQTRHVFGKHFTNDDPDDLYLNWSTGRTVHVGGGAAADLNVTGNSFVGGRVGVHTSSPAFDMQVVGTICANTFCNPSDARLKTDVVEMSGVADRLSQVRPVTFTPTTAPPESDPRRQAGVLAQELAGPFPELVLPMGDDAGHLAVDYAGLAGVLVGAVNELRAANQALEQRLAELEQRTPESEPADGAR